MNSNYAHAVIMKRFQALPKANLILSNHFDKAENW